MKHNLKQELTSSMDAICFSQETKEAMVEKLMTQTKEPPINHSKQSRKKLILVALVAVILIATLTGAAAFTRWTDSMNEYYKATQSQREFAQKSGLSSILESSAESTHQISDTDQGITISAVQSVIGKYNAQLIFRIDGLAPPPGEMPSIQIESLEIEDAHCVVSPLSFRTSNLNSDGTPIYTSDNGSIEFTLPLALCEGGTHFDKIIEIRFKAIGTESRPNMYEGNWTLRWKLTGTNNSIFTTPRVPIGNSEMTLMEIELTPISVYTSFKIPNSDGRIINNDPKQSWQRTNLPDASALFIGLHLIDDSILFFSEQTGFSSLYSDEGLRIRKPDLAEEILSEQAVLLTENRFLKTIINPNDVDALIFLKAYENYAESSTFSEEDYILVPIY